MVDSFSVLFDTLHTVKLGPDKIFCNKVYPVLVDNNRRQDVSYNWIGTTVDQYSLTVDTTGMYVLAATTVCGTTYDSILVKFLQPPTKPNWRFPNRFCDVISDTLDALNPGSTYLWNDGFTGQKRVVTEPGFQSVTISNICGDVTASKIYNITKSPSVNLGKDRITRKPFSVFLDAGKHDNATYLWSTGSSYQSIFVDSFGTYWVEVKNQCGTDKDTIEVSELLNVEDPAIDNLVLYPNPNNGEFYIKGFKEEIESIKLLNALGEEVSISITAQNENKKISVQEQCSGVFLLVVQTSNKQLVQTIFISYWAVFQTITGVHK